MRVTKQLGEKNVYNKTGAWLAEDGFRGYLTKKTAKHVCLKVKIISKFQLQELRPLRQRPSYKIKAEESEKPLRRRLTSA